MGQALESASVLFAAARASGYVVHQLYSDLDMMVDLGIEEIQPGNESLSTETLVRLRKGDSGPQHVGLLREASSRQMLISQICDGGPLEPEISRDMSFRFEAGPDGFLSFAAPQA